MFFPVPARLLANPAWDYHRGQWQGLSAPGGELRLNRAFRFKPRLICRPSTEIPNAMSAPLFPDDLQMRIRDALEASHEALKLAERELAASVEDAERWRWVAVGLVSALQAALIAALSGYETAEPQAVLVPGQPDRVAPLALLLRRARGGDYLAAPERPDISAGTLERLEALARLRNAAVHGLSFDLPRDPAALARPAVRLIQHLLIRHPAFDRRPHGVVLALIGDVTGRLLKGLGSGEV